MAPTSRWRAVLARRFGHSPSGVSGHLSALRGAGLLTCYRVRHQVIYERTPLGIAITGAAAAATATVDVR